MNHLKIIAIAICMLGFGTVYSQNIPRKGKVKFTPPEMVQYSDTSASPDIKKKEYKSKQWHQGDDIVTQETNGNDKTPSKKIRKVHSIPPPPPPAAPPPPLPVKHLQKA